LMASSDIHVMVNGMPGPMATAAAEACLRKGLKLARVAMTGPEVEPQMITVYDKVSDSAADVKLIPSSDVEEIKATIAGFKEAYGNNFVSIDFTHPSAVNSNALFYIETGLPFVMGTTGGDRDKLIKDVDGAKHFAIISPNMAKQIVALQSTLEDLATKYPSSFAGYKLNVKESHQKTKADTSGTAKAIIGSLKEITDDDFNIETDIKMIRDDKEAMDFNVPEDYLKGHAFHTYTLTSPDGTVEFSLSHNVCGRSIYADGTADACKFLVKKLNEQAQGQVWTMGDVLAAGDLE